MKEEKINLEIGRRLKELRQLNGLKQKDIAALFGITKGAYSRIEGGKTSLKLQNIFKLRERFNISVDWLLFGEEDFKGFGDDVREMLAGMKADKMLMHGLLSYYFSIKGKAIKEDQDQIDKEGKENVHRG